VKAFLFSGLIAALLFPSLGVSQDTIRVTTALTIVEVITLDPTTGLPVLDLKKQDFRVTDNGNEVPISTFDSGAHYGTQPVVIWFVVLCNEREKFGGSAEFVGRLNLFRPALDHLDKTDTVGVARWCDNGETELDLLPTSDRNQIIEALAQAIKPIAFVGSSRDANKVGEVTYRRMVRLIIQDAQNRNPRPLPVLVFLDGDRTGQPLGELNQVVDDLLETSGIVFGIKDKHIPDMSPLKNGEQEQISHYMAYHTGGQYFSVFSEDYATALDMIFVQLHFRYDLGFRPPSIDDKRHRLDVELTGQARVDHKDIRLRYREEYIPVSEKPSWLK
jgi:hypothetical protein